MNDLNKEQLDEILRKHQMWLDEVEGGECADLSCANLSFANLSFANLSSADLSSANLSFANLSSANLSSSCLHYASLAYADLSGANLSNADLYCSNLVSADLSGANLSNADLTNANLSDAELTGANLEDLCSLLVASGNMAEIKTIQCEEWPVVYTATHMQIGCQLHELDDWWSFSDERISRMSVDALSWWQKWKPVLKMIIDASPAI